MVRHLHGKHTYCSEFKGTNTDAHSLLLKPMFHNYEKIARLMPCLGELLQRDTSTQVRKCFGVTAEVGEQYKHSRTQGVE